jgi:putative membrane protein
MIRLLIEWLLSALALIVVAFVVPGFEVAGIGSALWAALVVGLLNVTLGWVLHFLTFPLTLLTLGLFYFVVNAIILYIASGLVPGFRIKNFGSALLGALVLALVHYLFRFFW